MIKENELPTQTTLPSSWYLRMVSDTGMSKRIASSLVKWSIEDVIDLETSLSGKQDLSTLKSMVAYLDATGQSVGSGFDMGTIANQTELDSVFCGLFTAPVPFAITNIGDVYGVLAISRNALGDDSTQDNTAASQLLFTSNGLYLRSYSTSWGLYRYVGGGVQPQPVTRAQLIDLMDDQELVQGTKYIITDHPNDMGIIVEAASSSQISQYALRLACQPKYYVAGPYMTGSGGTVEEYWNGVYEHGTTPAEGGIYIYAGMVYKNLTGDDTTPPGEYILNSTDWELKTVEWGDYYSPNICEVIYKIGLTTSPVDEPCGVVQRQTDINNNTFGQALTGDPTLAQRTRIDYNDWGHPNIRNCELLNCWANKEDCEFIGVRGYGQVYRNKTTNLASVRLTDDAVLIYDNAVLTVFDCDIRGDIYSNSTVIVRYSDINAYVASNFSLTITDCESNSPITGNASSSITSSYIFGTFRGNETLTITDCEVNSAITNNTTLTVTSSNISGTLNLISGTIDKSTLFGSLSNCGVDIDDSTTTAQSSFVNVPTLVINQSTISAGGSTGATSINLSYVTFIRGNCFGTIVVEDSTVNVYGGVTGSILTSNIRCGAMDGTINIQNSRIFCPIDSLIEGLTMLSSVIDGATMDLSGTNVITKSIISGMANVFNDGGTLTIENSNIDSSIVNDGNDATLLIEDSRKVFGDINNAGTLTIQKSIILGAITNPLSKIIVFNNCHVDYNVAFNSTNIDSSILTSFIRCRFLEGFSIYSINGGGSLYDSVLASEINETLSGGDTTLGGIGACAHIAGTLRVDTGTWNKGEFLTGTLQDILANGINVTKGTGLSLTVKSSGWYNIDYNASASANAMVLEFQCFIGANAIPQSYKKVSYVSGQHLNTSSSFMVYLTSGQTVDLKYKHDKGSYEDIIVANITITANKN